MIDPIAEALDEIRLAREESPEDEILALAELAVQAALLVDWRTAQIGAQRFVWSADYEVEIVGRPDRFRSLAAAVVAWVAQTRWTAPAQTVH
jgi:hypothetical protein